MGSGMVIENKAYLWATGVPVNHTGVCTQTPLHIAAAQGHEALLQVMKALSFSKV